MLLTTTNIAEVVNATSLEAKFIDFIAMQAQADNETFTITDGKRARIGEVSYILLSDGKVRGRCPVIGAFIAKYL